MTRVMRGLQAVEQEKLRSVDPQAMQAHVKAMEQLEVSVKEIQSFLGTYTTTYLNIISQDHSLINTSLVYVSIALLYPHWLALQDIVNTFSKLREVEGVHEASRLIWNTSMPLMQPDWRRYSKRALNSAARALDVISSPLHRLRAQLHLEAAKCDAAEDSLIKVFASLLPDKTTSYFPLAIHLILVTPHWLYT
jgi:hypothetical protein